MDDSSGGSSSRAALGQMPLQPGLSSTFHFNGSQGPMVWSPADQPGGLVAGAAAGLGMGGTSRSELAPQPVAGGPRAISLQPKFDTKQPGAAEAWGADGDGAAAAAAAASAAAAAAADAGMSTIAAAAMVASEEHTAKRPRLLPRGASPPEGAPCSSEALELVIPPLCRMSPRNHHFSLLSSLFFV